MLMEAHEAYRAGNIDTALLKYAMLAELGYEVAQSNVAFILDHGMSTSLCQLQKPQARVVIFPGVTVLPVIPLLLGQSFLLVWQFFDIFSQLYGGFHWPVKV